MRSGDDGSKISLLLLGVSKGKYVIWALQIRENEGLSTVRNLSVDWKHHLQELGESHRQQSSL